MKFYTAFMEFYRNILKKIPLVHRLIYWLMSNLLILLETLNGFQTNPTDPLSGRVEYLLKRTESGSMKVVREVAQLDWVYLDIGANIGYYTKIFSKLAGSQGKVIAFEPHPLNHQLLTHNVGNQNNVMVLKKAASDIIGQITLYDSSTSSATASIYFDEETRESIWNEFKNELSPKIKAGFKPQEYQVDTITVDQALSELNIDQVNLIKLDIEGAEILALRGMQKVIERSNDLYLLIEYAPHYQTLAGNKPIELLNFLQELGFDDIQAILEEKGNLIPVSQIINSDGYYQGNLRRTFYLNLLCKKGGNDEK